MKTDLKKILSISGEQGLWLFISQAKNGIIAESMLTGIRKTFGITAKVTSLSDISIYTSDEEMSLRDVLIKMKDTLADKPAPEAKSDSRTLVSLFESVIPEYDHDRFYVSHMKKVVTWYNIINEHASFDFEDPEAAAQEGETETESKAE